MSRFPSPAIAGPLLRLFGDGSLAGLTELELLDRFSAAGDEQAFEALVERHGPMVLAVCRRVLGNGPDAEDAFQATFLVLARKAGQLRRRELLGPWLHRVALRASWRAAAVARRRRRVEGPAGDALDQMAGPDDRPDPDRELLHREIDRLPAAYRRVVLLCDLSGHSHSEAASLLGWPIGTVKGRHFRARELLRSRLARLGLAVSAMALTQAGARAAVPAGLAARVTQAAVRISYTGTAWLGISVIPAERLMKGVLVAMFLEKIRLGGAVLIPTLLLGLATMAGAARWQEEERNGQRAQVIPPPGEPAKTSRPGAVDGLIGRWELRSSSTRDGRDLLSQHPYRTWIFEPLKEDLAALLRYEGKALLLTLKKDKGEDIKAIVVARDGDEHGQYDMYTNLLLIDSLDAKPDALGIFKFDGSVLTMAHADAKTRPGSFGMANNANMVINLYVRNKRPESVTAPAGLAMGMDTHVKGPSPATPVAGGPSSPDPSTREEAAAEEMVRIQHTIREIRDQLEQLSETTAQARIDAEGARFQAELIQEEIRERSAALRKLEDQPEGKEETRLNLERRLGQQRSMLPTVLEEAARAELKVEQTKREIDRLNDELDAVYRDRRATGGTLERP